MKVYYLNYSLSLKTNLSSKLVNVGNSIVITPKEQEEI